MSPFVVEDDNLSNAWLRVINCISKRPGNEITPLLLSLTKFEESEVVRETLDKHLKGNDKASVHTVAETIFPNSLYQLCGYDRNKLYENYLNILPRIKAVDSQSNGRGTYFERLIAFDGGDKKINQLEMIVSSFEDGNINRRSKFQASIFDATKDHLERPYQRFPCLQHVTFYKTSNGGIVMNSFYAIQYLYERGYGNWLGLINLGRFVANELNLELERFNCYVGVEKLDMTKAKANLLLERMPKVIFSETPNENMIYG